jgi:hypothetical protein
MLSLISLIWSGIKSVLGIVSSTEQAKYTAEGQEIVAVAQMQASVQVRWWFVAIIPPLFAFPYIAYVWKSVLWDNVLAIAFDIPGQSTPALNGPLGVVMMIIVGFYFFHNLLGAE